MWIPLFRLIGYVALAAGTSPIVGAYDYGTNGMDGTSFWSRLLVAVALAAVITVIGEGGLRITRRLRRH